MPDNNSQKLQKTKEELQQEIDNIENMLDDSIGKVKQEVSTVDPREQIRQNPLPAVGIAIVAGFLLGKTGSKKKKGGSSSKNEVGSAVWKEVKQRVLKIGVKKAGDYVEDYLSEAIAQKTQS